MENLETKRFGRYEVLGELGRGAMGVVYKARDPQIDRLVALKTVALRGVDKEAEEEFRQRFLNEAQAAGKLHHPGIVAVFDVGEEEENHDPYIVLEYVAGEALNKMLAREKKLALEKALGLAAEIAEALDYAHGQGVTHRDIKPGNILITQQGRAKIADFGIAKLNLAHFTLPGRVLGTPAYMAPEQLTGERADGRSDLFSLGVILYVMVTGHSPFQGTSATTVMYKVANKEPVAASALNLDVPKELDAVIAQAMAKDPEERYQRGADFAADLQQLQAAHVPGATTSFLQAGSALSQSRLNQPPAVGLAYAAKVVRGAVRKAPVKDLVLGVATVIMLLIVGVQSKLLVGSRESAGETGRVAEMRAAQVQPAAPSADGKESPLLATPARSGAPATAGPMAKKAPAEAASKKVEKRAQHREVIVATATVELAIRHQFKDAMLTVYVDDQLALTRELHGGGQKKLVVFGGVHGMESETVKVPAGKHVLRIRTQSGDQTVDLSKTIAAELAGGDDKTLLITFDRKSGMRVEWQ